ncbi:MAG: hypothetical protein ACKOQ8_03770, partial [Micrococcales bacterium]
LSSIPLLGGLSAIAVATTLGLMSLSELQFQDRLVKDQAELLATAVASDVAKVAAPGGAGAGITQNQLGLSFAMALTELGFATSEFAVAQVASVDSVTVEVGLCRTAKPWALAWLGSLTPESRVCAMARARTI